MCACTCSIEFGVRGEGVLEGEVEIECEDSGVSGESGEVCGET
jgi:hypothetical protein